MADRRSAWPTATPPPRAGSHSSSQRSCAGRRRWRRRRRRDRSPPAVSRDGGSGRSRWPQSRSGPDTGPGCSARRHRRGRDRTRCRAVTVGRRLARVARRRAVVGRVETPSPSTSAAAGVPARPSSFVSGLSRRCQSGRSCRSSRRLASPSASSGSTALGQRRGPRRPRRAGVVDRIESPGPGRRRGRSPPASRARDHNAGVQPPIAHGLVAQSDAVLSTEREQQVLSSAG